MIQKVHRYDCRSLTPIYSRRLRKELFLHFRVELFGVFLIGRFEIVVGRLLRKFSFCAARWMICAALRSSTPLIARRSLTEALSMDSTSV